MKRNMMKKLLVLALALALVAGLAISANAATHPDDAPYDCERVWIPNGDGTHTGTCSCGVTETLPCFGGTADCQNPAICEVCKAAYGKLSEHDIQFERTMTGYLFLRCKTTGCTKSYNALIKLNTSDYVYTGSEITPDYSMVYTPEDWNFGAPTITIENNVNVGMGTVKAYFAKWDKTISRGFYIVAKELEASMVEQDAESGYYTGEAHTPAITLTYNGKTLVEGTDYTISWDGALTEKGTYTATITGKGNFKGSVTATYEVKCDHEWSYIPKGNGTHDRVCQNDGCDASENVACSGGTATCQNQANCEHCGIPYGKLGEHDIQLSRPMTGYLFLRCETTGCTKSYNALIKLNTSDYVYTGSEITPDYSMVYTPEDWNFGEPTITIENNVNVGIGDIKAYFAKWDVTISRGFYIVAKELEDSMVNAPETGFYTGEAHDPEIVLTYNGKTLVEGTDYTISWDGALTEKGTYTATITGKGNFKGSVTATYEIVCDHDFTYIPKGNGTHDYACQNDGCDEKGNEACSGGTATCQNQANCEHCGIPYGELGEHDVQFERTMTGYLFLRCKTTGCTKSYNALIKVNTSDYVYTGSEITPDYSMVYTPEDWNFGEPTITIENNVNVGIGNIKAYFAKWDKTISRGFYIVPKALEDSMVNAPESGTYTGDVHTPEIVLTYNGKTLVEGTDYTITWDGALTDVGTYTATITGKGNFKGTLTFTYEITCEHDFTYIPKGNGTHDRVCQNPGCEEAGNVACSGGTATCQNQANCEFCGIPYGELGEHDVQFERTMTGYLFLRCKTKGCTASYNALLKVTGEYVYTGSEIVPEYSVVFTPDAQAFGTYAISFENNVNAGMGTVKAYFGKWDKTITRSFIISPKALEDSMVKQSGKSGLYSGEAHEPKFKLTFNSKTLVEGTDYTVAWDGDLTEVGTYTATITGKGNFTDTVEITYVVKEFNKDVAEVEEMIEDLPKTADPDDEDVREAAEEAKEAYEALGEDKDQVNKKLVTKLNNLLAALKDYKIIKGNGQRWYKNAEELVSLTFTANGPYDKFDYIKIDGEILDSKYYTSKEGSTIVTLKASYLEGLSYAKHTIAIGYDDGDLSGEATGYFRVTLLSDSPATGDTTNIVLLSVLALSSLLGMAAMVIARKKRGA